MRTNLVNPPQFMLLVLILMMRQPASVSIAQGLTEEAQGTSGILHVFLLAGQSNMEGQGVVDLDHPQHYNGGQGILQRVMHAPKSAWRYAHIQDSGGQWIERDDVDIVITTGGTGFTGRDVTPDAAEPLFEKRMDGFSVAFHQLSYEKICTSTIQSRATAGVAGSTFIFCLPGSPGACKDGWDGILEKQLDYRHMPCNFVEIMPRLDEHLKRGGGS